MTTVFDIPAGTLINKVAEELKAVSEIEAPAWAEYAKTGVHKQLPPENPDWWYVRAAAVLRRIYVDGPLGVERMRTVYGGMQDNGSKPSHFRKGSGSIARKVMQQLEAAGLIEKVPAGRAVTAKGRKFLDGIAYSLKDEAVKAAPGLAKY
ncbi:MAG: 30S ribosomal protein S19e [Methanocorpusculum sp.]|nr:30S ribosomal protein S19e [Candidatus Methanocorpusculum equi]MCQ2357166.1 30S ribosomal protein S19e [Methanocorpusculum sp.]MCQ2376646.1 30S ribosomal protein S19e [Methanocorpusculum sp.]MDO5847276.1 30S ribosomal protein S19e [Methanocorpusculum sp.]HJJ44954.1 30S ribosomal protein S19e [Methanocorpusculum sp.]